MGHRKRWEVKDRESKSPNIKGRKFPQLAKLVNNKDMNAPG
jgi:hypothetical protein